MREVLSQQVQTTVRAEKDAWISEARIARELETERQTDRALSQAERDVRRRDPYAGVVAARIDQIFRDASQDIVDGDGLIRSFSDYLKGFSLLEVATFDGALGSGVDLWL